MLLFILIARVTTALPISPLHTFTVFLLRQEAELRLLIAVKIASRSANSLDASLERSFEDARRTCQGKKRNWGYVSGVIKKSY